jgi:hypothetical protein
VYVLGGLVAALVLVLVRRSGVRALLGGLVSARLRIRRVGRCSRLSPFPAGGD